MIRDAVKRIREQVSEVELMRTVEEIASHHRIQASGGYRDAVHALKKIIESYGIRTEIEGFKADFGEMYLTTPLFPEWNCRSARAELVSPKEMKLADYSECPISVMQKSFPHRDANPLDIVLLDKGSDEAEYEDLDLKGKLIFVRDDFNAYIDWAIRRRGAIGIISDYVVETPGARDRSTQYNVRKYTTFWWTEPTDIEPFGFVITPGQGDELAEICRSVKACFEEGKSDSPYPQAICTVDSEMRAGSFENLVAELPGAEAGEIWLTAHLCHPSPSANDNASGVAAAIEALRTVKQLCENGVLRPLRKTLKILLVPEFLGTYAHLSRMESFDNVYAAFNLDMVGGDQRQGYGPLTLCMTSLASPSLAGDLARMILDELKKDIDGFSTYTKVPAFNAAVTSFTAGSDDFILQDPTVGIPCPTLGQWPDMFYHTSGDTPDRVDPKLLAVSTALAAAYGYLLCSMDEGECGELSAAAVSHLAANLAAIDGSYRGEADYRTAYYRKSAEDIRWMLGDNPRSEELAVRQKTAVDRIAEALKEYIPEDASYIGGDARVPVRTYVSPVNNILEFTGGDEGKKKAAKSYIEEHRADYNDSMAAEVLIQYHIDGKNTVEEIADLVEIEIRCRCRTAVREYIETLVRLGLCRFK